MNVMSNTQAAGQRKDVVKVFLSWSGNRARYVAAYLKDWLENIFHSGVETFMSDADIGAGRDWSAEIVKGLDDSNFGIICTTPENRVKPWLMFEAGAIAKKFQKSHCVPFLIEMSPSDLSRNPLSRFQAKQANLSKDVLEVLQAINVASGTPVMKEGVLKTTFEKFWGDLEEHLKNMPKADEEAPPAPSQEQILGDLLASVQELHEKFDSSSAFGFGSVYSVTASSEDDGSSVDSVSDDEAPGAK